MRAIVMVLGMLVALPAVAGWEKVGDSDSGTHYIDPSSIDNRGALRRVLELLEFKHPQKDDVTSVQRVVEYDCKEHRRRLLQLTTYVRGVIFSKKNDTVELEENHTNWRINPPNSIAETIHNRLCSK